MWIELIFNCYTQLTRQKIYSVCALYNFDFPNKHFNCKKVELKNKQTNSTSSQKSWHLALSLPFKIFVTIRHSWSLNFSPFRFPWLPYWDALLIKHDDDYKKTLKTLNYQFPSGGMHNPRGMGWVIQRYMKNNW